MKAPDFSLPDQRGNTHSLSDYKGKWLVVYFYPKDNTPGCTKEACAFRDSFSAFETLGVSVIGISKDSESSHKKFSDKYKLPFTLLSDENLDTIKAYNAWGKKKFLGKEYDGIFRKTYVIDPKGEIRNIYEKVTPNTHALEILHDLSSLQ